MDQRHLFEPQDRPAEIVLRPYQAACVEAVYSHLRDFDDNPVAVIPTAGGKTPIMATICRDAVKHWGGRVLVLAHVKELLEQAADKLRRICHGIPFGIYSAGLNRRDVRQPIIVAGIQSIYRKALDLDPFDLAIVDEAHGISPEGDGMYRQFLAEAKIANPRLRVIGFTATPFRTKSGSICSPDGFLNTICYEIGVKELILDGFLSPLITKNGQTRAELGALHVRAGEFIASEVDAAMDVDEIVNGACREIVEYMVDRKSCLIFASSVEHAGHIQEAMQSLGHPCDFVSGETPAVLRSRILEAFVDGRSKYLVNVNVLTTGFDAPRIDCVALLRPTNSPGLYYQMVGRGFRLFPGKRDCLILDFGGNVVRHGPVDQVKAKDRNASGKAGETPAKECPKCKSLVATGYSICPDCGFEFPPPERQRHDTTASDAGIISGQVTISTYTVVQTFYTVHTKRGASEDDPKTMRVDYMVGLGQCKSEWICIEHEGFARQKAEKWWRERSPDPFPESAERAAEIGDGGGLAEPVEIRVRSVAGERYDRVVDYVLGDKPEALPVCESWERNNPDDEIPF